jgi:hypothetical protein
MAERQAKKSSVPAKFRGDIRAMSRTVKAMKPRPSTSELTNSANNPKFGLGRLPFSAPPVQGLGPWYLRDIS